MSTGELLINGGFNLWTRFDPAEPAFVTDGTFAADRWRVRDAVPQGGAIRQARSEEAPPATGAECSLELRGGEGVTQAVYIGQCIEAPACGRELRFAVWCLAQHPSASACAARLVVGSPIARDVFDGTVETVWRSGEITMTTNAWRRLELTFDTTALRPYGLQVELEFAAGFLAHPAARICLAAASLHPAAFPLPAPREQAVETLLARRFCQRHSAWTVNAIGRALLCNPHELHFQFTFPEMRVRPAVTLSQDNSVLGVFSADGTPQSGFNYDIPHSATGSILIRATKLDHQLRDGYLAFRGYRGALLLEAEL